MAINPSIFRAYDIRGRYPKEVNEEVALRLGRSLPVFFRGKRAVVGYDARLSSRSLQRALVRGLAAAGASVIRLGMVPTPVVSFAVLKSRASFGVVVSASHNPKQYNAFKIIDRNANQIGWEQGLWKIAKLTKKEILPAPRPGGVRTDRRMKKRYIRTLVQRFRRVARPFHPVTRKPRAEARGGMAIRREAIHWMPRPEGRGVGVHSKF